MGKSSKQANKYAILKLKFKFMVAGRTTVTVNRDYRSTIRTGPSFSFIYQEFSHPSFFNCKEILNKTDMIFCSVSFIELLQSPAGKDFTVITII
jgi:hypothetical protein